ncbi:uncharacterized protein J3R85_011996 [Psidium guajava]|nr:uncharacterized protein J3R85_011996 [Psidium guajava]
MSSPGGNAMGSHVSKSPRDPRAIPEKQKRIFFFAPLIYVKCTI